MSTSYKMSSEILFKEPSPDVLVNYFGNNPPPLQKNFFSKKNAHTKAKLHIFSNRTATNHQLLYLVCGENY